jgi:hypothetical protein
MMSSELVQALDRLRESVDALRDTIVDIAGPSEARPGQVYLDELQEMRAKGLIDERAFADKRKAFLDKF